MEAVESLQHLLEDPASGPRRVILPTELIVRQSTVGGVPRR
jgi:DNA-binding LacI/PurR family transcriptional regulator